MCNPLKKILNFLHEISWMKWYLPQTIWFNFHYLPFRQAKHLPILLSRPTFRKLGGRIKIDSADDKIYRGMIKLGLKTIGVSDGIGVVWENNGTIVFHGPCTLGAGVKLAVFDTGILSFGSHFTATDGLRVVCGKSITFENDVLIGWDTTVMDTNQHQLSSPNGQKIGQAYAPIRIGDATWFGFGCTILPGTEVPSKCVVASKSLLNKKYNIESYTLLAGIPALVKAHGVWRNPKDDRIEYLNN